ncbi:MAG: ferritin family protein [Candidatus Omnitrophica bacterium]|nr:ferritin family protein [Candidatus Omnitrophota bacterium]
MKIEERGGTFVISDFTELEAYTIAGTIEKDGVRFYEQLLREENRPEVKKTLSVLLNEEKRHVALFESYRDRAWEAQKEDLDADDLLNSINYGIFQRVSSKKKPADSRKALALGVAIENKSINFYQACMRHVSSESTREALRTIIEEEKRHKDIFERMLKPGSGI